MGIIDKNTIRFAVNRGLDVVDATVGALIIVFVMLPIVVLVDKFTDIPERIDTDSPWFWVSAIVLGGFIYMCARYITSPLKRRIRAKLLRGD